MIAEQMKTSLQEWAPTSLVVEGNENYGLYMRAYIGELGVLHLSIVLDEDRDPAEDTFFSHRNNGQEVVGFSGPLEQVLQRVVGLARLPH
jgi:hypothetical protein